MNPRVGGVRGFLADAGVIGALRESEMLTNASSQLMARTSLVPRYSAQRGTFGTGQAAFA